MRYVPLELLPELEAAIAVELEHGSWARRRDALGVALGLHGLRVGEVRRARRADLYVAGCRLSVARFKRGMAREIPLDQSLVSALLSWRADSTCPWLRGEPGPGAGRVPRAAQHRRAGQDAGATETLYRMKG